MCTVSIIPLASDLRFVINRDEKRDRPDAARPQIVPLEDGGLAVWPIDEQGGGTWVAATSAGVVFGLLNGNPRPYPQLPPPARLISRGLVIPSLVSATSAVDAVHALENAVELDRLAPFRLVVADRWAIADAVWDRTRLTINTRAVAPVCYVSSGLGDERVAPRLELWQSMVASGLSMEQAQENFHRHQWPDRPQISVMMSRPDARTVSVTRIDIRADQDSTLLYIDDRGAQRIAIPHRHPRIGAYSLPLTRSTLGPVTC